MRLSLTCIILICAYSIATGQRLVSSSSEIRFYSEAPVEDIEAFSKEARGILDLKSGQFAFIVPIQTFEFDKSLMKEHFNEKYMETEQFPNSTFEGKVSLNPKKGSEENVDAKGRLTIHGVDNEVSIPTKILWNKDDEATISATFIVKLEDYNIEIPSILWKNIAEEIEVNVSFTLKAK